MQTKLWYIQLLLQHMQITPIILQFLRLLFVCLSPQTCVHKQSYAEQGTGRAGYWYYSLSVPRSHVKTYHCQCCTAEQFHHANLLI